jgi:hypothetical protein
VHTTPPLDRACVKTCSTRMRRIIH